MKKNLLRAGLLVLVLFGLTKLIERPAHAVACETARGCVQAGTFCLCPPPPNAK